MKLYFRDGREYTGNQVCSYTVDPRDPTMAQGKVYVLGPCKGCHGDAIQKPHEGFAKRCGICHGTGRQRNRAWYSVYSREKLDAIETNARPQLKPGDLASLVVQEEKRAFAQFCREREDFLSDLFTYIGMDESLSSMVGFIENGIVPTPSQIRAAIIVLKRLKENRTK